MTLRGSNLRVRLAVVLSVLVVVSAADPAEASLAPPPAPAGGGTLAIATTSTGETALLEWEPTPLGTTTRWRVGRDLLEVEVRRCDPTSTAVCGIAATINGVAADPGALLELLTPSAASPAAETAFDSLIAALHDPAGFAEGAVDLAARLDVALNERIGKISPDASCFFPCTGCAASVVAYGVALGAVVSACGGPVVGWACAVSFIKLTIGKTVVLSACNACFECVDAIDACPCAGQPACDCA